MQVHRNLEALPPLRRPVVTIGSFDGVHLGHKKLLERIRQHARSIDGESVLVTFDPHPRHVLASDGPPVRLLTTTAEKIERIAAQGIDHVVIVEFSHAFAKQTATQYLQDFLFGHFTPQTVVIGYDHRYGAGREGDIVLLRKLAAGAGVEVDEISARDIDKIAVSSTRIRTAIMQGRIRAANALLGDPYMLTGRVVHGEAIGRTIGFPTANLDLDAPHKLLPADGVYAVSCSRQQAAGHYPEELPGMLYIGERPSLEGKRPRSIEVNLLNFDEDLYGQLLRVKLIERIREDRAFDGLEALRTQIETDRRATTRIFAKL